MRDFKELNKTLELIEFLDSIQGTLYRTENHQPKLMVRHFDADLPTHYIADYIKIAESCTRWIKNRPALSKIISVETITEQGADFISRPFHVYQTSLGFYDRMEDKREIPSELEPMKALVRQLTGTPETSQYKIIERVISQSLLDESNKTYFNWEDKTFIIVEFKIGLNDLKEWHNS